MAKREMDKRMWVPDKARLVKVRLHNRGVDVETPWAEDLGPLEGSRLGRLVRIGNVPFLHAKPTYGDVIAVVPDPGDDVLEWDAAGVAFEDMGTRIAQDDGRWVAIIDYWPRLPAEDLKGVFKALDIAGEKIDVAVEGAFVGHDGRTARAYLAVPRSMTLQDVLEWLRSDVNEADFKLVHPVDDA
jgi:hypothetical protein